jgi:release factor glutamine methyltransferase
MTKWHPLRSLHQDSTVSASWKQLDKLAEERGKQCASATLPTLNHASMKDYAHVYEPSDDTYLLLDAILLDIQNVGGGEGDREEHISATQPHPPLLNLLEIGTGSGVPITYLAQQLQQRNQYSVHALATDINPQALQFAQKTATENGVTLHTTHCCDLATALLDDYSHKIHVLLFNPPYVPTPDDEVTGNGIEASWAGGVRGRRVIDRALPQIAQLLLTGSDDGCKGGTKAASACYMITVDDNEPEEIANILSKNYHRTMTPLLRRRAHNEYLTVQKIT